MEPISNFLGSLLGFLLGYLFGHRDLRQEKILISITPGKMAKVFRATGGTEAVEIALQAAMSYTKRTKFIPGKFRNVKKLWIEF